MEINQLHEIFFSRLRLSIIACLYTRKMYFKELKNVTGATDGNLGVQLKKLVLGNYVESKTKIIKNKANTEYSLTHKGREAFKDYVQLLEGIVTQEK